MIERNEAVSEIIAPLREIKSIKTPRKRLRDYGFKKPPFRLEDHSVFLGRENEMKAMSEEISRIYEDKIKYVYVVGPTGIGKTSFLEAYMRILTDHYVDISRKMQIIKYDDFIEDVIDEETDTNIFALFFDEVSSRFQELINDHFLSNFYGDTLKVVIIAISPIQALEKRSKDPSITLGPFSDTQIVKILEENLKMSKGGDSETSPFDESAIREISHFSMGNPRLAKHIAYQALFHHIALSKEGDMGQEDIKEVVKLYFQTEERPSYELLNKLFTDKKHRKILLYLIKSQSTHLTVMSERLGYSRRALLYHLKYLMNEGVVYSRRKGRRIEYEVSEIWRVAIENNTLYVQSGMEGRE